MILQFQGESGTSPGTVLLNRPLNWSLLSKFLRPTSSFSALQQLAPVKTLLRICQRFDVVSGGHAPLQRRMRVSSSVNITDKFTVSFWSLETGIWVENCRNLR